MIKAEDIAKYGFADLTPQEDGTFSLDAVMDARAKQVRELALQDKDFIEPIKEAAKKEASAIERKRAIKAMRTKFGLDITNSQIDEMDVDAVIDIVHTASTAKTSTDIKELQDKIIEANKKAQAAEEALTTKAAEIEKKFASKIALKEVDKQVLKKTGTEKMIVSSETTLSLYHLGLQKHGYFIHLSEDGSVRYTTDEAGQYAVLRSDGTGRADTDYLFDIILDEFKQKNNGSGGGNPMPSGGGQPKAVSEHMRKLQSAFNRR